MFKEPHITIIAIPEIIEFQTHYQLSTVHNTNQCVKSMIYKDFKTLSSKHRGCVIVFQIWFGLNIRITNFASERPVLLLFNGLFSWWSNSSCFKGWFKNPITKAINNPQVNGLMQVGSPLFTAVQIVLPNVTQALRSVCLLYQPKLITHCWWYHLSKIAILMLVTFRIGT